MSTTTVTAIKTPTPIPVLNIPPITSHELTDKARNAITTRVKNVEVFIISNFCKPEFDDCQIQDFLTVLIANSKAKH